MDRDSSETALPAKTSGQANMLKAFHDRLRDLCAENGEGAWQTRQQRIESQAKQARAAADQVGILRQLLPFDMILCRPDPAMEKFLSLYPA